jgi:predicted HTH domain antitoxin
MPLSPPDEDAEGQARFGLVGMSAREMRIAACVQWYAQGLVSQERAAEIAGLSRAEFLEELFRRKVPACQVTLEELIEEIEHQ